MIYNQTFRLPKDLIDQVTHYLSLPRGLDDDAYQGEDNTIILATAHFPNGYEMDITKNHHGQRLFCSMNMEWNFVVQSASSMSLDVGNWNTTTCTIK